MALDEALMARARRTGETVLRTYSWCAPTLSLGRNQRARDEYDGGALRDAGVEVVRRPTGGRALLHHREVTYSVTAPLAAGETVAAAYSRINALLVNALGILGVPAEIASPPTRAVMPTARPCFAEPARGELVCAGRKLVGSAQWRDDGALLQHGSILVDDDQGAIARLMRRAEGLPTAPTATATLRGVLGRAPALAEVHDAIALAVAAATGARPLALERDPTTDADADRLSARYRDDAWTWRR